MIQNSVILQIWRFGDCRRLLQEPYSEIPVRREQDGLSPAEPTIGWFVFTAGDSLVVVSKWDGRRDLVRVLRPRRQNSVIVSEHAVVHKLLLRLDGVE